MTPPHKPSAAAHDTRFDAEAARARLAHARGPAYWRSLEELADAEGFRSWLRTQHPQLAEMLTLDRRGFMQLLGASLALAGLGACSRPPQTQIVPYVNAPDTQVAGLPRYFASVLEREGVARGVLIQSSMGRPTKIEGNPQHPASLGGTDIFAQASILQLWDPDRSQAVMQGLVVASWDQLVKATLPLRMRFDANGGAGLHLLSGALTSPTLAAQIDALRAKYPQARWHVHEPAGNDNAFEGAKLAFGAPLATRLHLDRAKVILALDADPLTDPAAGVRYGRDFAAARDPDGGGGRMSRLYAVEPTPSITGSMADHRLPLESWRIEAFARRLGRKLGVVAADDDDAAPDGREARWLDALAADLLAHRQAALVVVGPTQPARLHALGHALNAALGGAGNTIEYSAPVQTLPGEDSGIAELARAMHAGSVDTLLMLGVNPVYDAPADLDFAAALKKLSHSLHLGLYHDETGASAQWHLPMAHALESWSDGRAFDGTASIAQPGIAPLYGGKSAAELLALLFGDGESDRDLVRRQWRERVPDEMAWTTALRAGVIAGTVLPATTPPRPTLPANEPRPSGDAAEELELLFRPDPTIGDGAWSNNGWLQELPKPLTQLTWDNPALISPALATQLGLANGDVVELQSQGRRLRAAVWIMPGQAARSVTLHLGYGRRRAGRVGDGLGFDAYALRTSGALWSTQDLRIAKTGAKYPLAATQHHFNMEGRDLVRAGTLAQYLAEPRFATAHERYPGTPPSLYPDHPRGEVAWGMSIDLNACIGCKACTIACQSENSIPVVGKDQVSRGREMHWIRVDRYYEGAAENPRSVSQPVPCMMCEHAPCELVCPVGATVHVAGGLNTQVYNRCVGTRFCSNNCPYKVRRFNFLHYADTTTPQLQAMRNPEVSVRWRGVMEKCTYCIQRIDNARIEADKQSRPIRDGEVLTACQAVCPTQAIRFGNIADPESQVAQAKASPRDYVLLGELNTRPRTSYLARLRNPNPALEDERERGG